MPSLTGGEMPRKMARVIKSVIEVNIRSRNSKSRTINSLLGCKETKKKEQIVQWKRKWRFIVARDDPTQSIHCLAEYFYNVKHGSSISQKISVIKTNTCDDITKIVHSGILIHALS